MYSREYMIMKLQVAKAHPYSTKSHKLILKFKLIDKQNQFHTHLQTYPFL